MINTLTRFIPLFLIMLIGFILKRKNILSDQIVDGLKKIVVTTALPAVLFLSFLSMEIKGSAFLLFAATFLICILLYAMGILFQKTGLCSYSLSPFFFTGFEFGMVGIALFSGIFGIENLGSILLIGLGHEFFIWFFYAPLLESKEKGSVQISRIVKDFFKSPIIIAILSALFLNLTGIYNQVSQSLIAVSLSDTLQMLSVLVTPLILLVIGSNLHLGNIPLKKGFHLIAFRLISVAIAGTALALFTHHFVMEVDRIMLFAFVTFFLLPPPYIIPVFLGENHKEESHFYNSILILATLVTLLLFMGAVFILGV